MHTFVTSLIRTVVPMGVGWLTTLLLSMGIELPPEAWDGLGATTTVAAGAGYYALIRALEKKWPVAGWFLGLAQQPVYSGKGITEKEIEEALRHMELPHSADEDGPDHRAEAPRA